MKNTLILLTLVFLTTKLYAVNSDAERYFNSGKSSFNEGAYSLAATYFQKAVLLDPESPHADEASFYIGLCFYQESIYDKAIQAFTKFSNDYPDSIFKERAVFIISDSYFKMKNYEKAVQRLRLFIRSYPQSKLVQNAHYLIGNSLLMSGKFDEASDEFGYILTNYPSGEYAGESFFRLGEAYFYDKDISKAADTLKGFLVKYPSSPMADEADFFLARCYYEKGDLDNAVKTFTRLSSLTNFNYWQDSLYYSSLIYIRKDDFEESVKYLSTLSLISNSDYHNEALYKLGLLYKLRGDLVRATDYFSILISSGKQDEYKSKGYLELASCYVIAGDNEDAVKTYEKLSELGGENTALALSRIAELKFNNKDYIGALENFSRIEKDFPDTEYGKSALYWTGRCFLEQGKYKEAVSTFEDYINIEPLSDKADEINLFIGNAYAGMEDYDTALVSYEKIIKKNNSSYIDEALNAEAWVYVKKNEYERAISLYRKIISNYPKSSLIPLAYYSIGIIQYNLKDYGEAIQTFKKVTSDFRDSSYAGDSLLKIGWIYYKQENFDGLIKYLRGADKNNFTADQKSESYNLTAWANYRLKAYPEAIGDFKISMEFTSNNSKILEDMLYIAKSYYNLENYTDSIESYKEYIEKASISGITNDIPAALSDMAWCYVKTGDDQKAAGIFQELVNKYPQSTYTAEALFKLAENYYNNSDYKNAILNYEKIINISGESDFSSASLYWMAWSYYNLKDKINALNYFVEYADKYPKGDYSIDSLLRAANIYYELNNYEKADIFYKKLMFLHPGSPEAEKAKVLEAEIELKVQSGGNEENLYKILIDKSKTSEGKAEAMYKLAMFYKRNGKNEDADKLFNQIIKISTGENAALSTYEMAEESLDNADYDNAIKLFGSIFYVYKFPEIYPQSLYGISMCYYKNGNHDAAKQYLLKLIDKYPSTIWADKANELIKEINTR
jgi:TolA-binding protein